MYSINYILYKLYIIIYQASFQLMAPLVTTAPLAAVFCHAQPGRARPVSSQNWMPEGPNRHDLPRNSVRAATVNTNKGHGTWQQRFAHVFEVQQLGKSWENHGKIKGKQDGSQIQVDVFKADWMTCLLFDCSRPSIDQGCQGFLSCSKPSAQEPAQFIGLTWLKKH